jgi:hypothetical protein
MNLDFKMRFMSKSGFKNEVYLKSNETVDPRKLVPV